MNAQLGKNMTLLGSNERKARLELPFEFDEVVLSQKERARILKGASESNLFEADADTLTVKEFRVCELSVRLRTINNARDSKAVLPDGTPLTEVTMYGRRGEVYLLGSYAAVKRVIAGDLPSNSVVLQKIASARRTIVDRKSRLTQSLNSLYTDKHATAAIVSGAETQIRFGHGYTIDDGVLSLTALIVQLEHLEEEVKAWEKWWAPWSALADDVSKRVGDVIAIAEVAMENLVKQLELSEPCSGEITRFSKIAAPLIDELRFYGRAVSKSDSELKVFLGMLSANQQIKNINVLGTLTQLWPSDALSIESALKNLAQIFSEFQQLERDVVAWKGFAEPRDDQLNVLLNRSTNVKVNYEKTLSDLKKQILS